MHLRPKLNVLGANCPIFQLTNQEIGHDINLKEFVIRIYNFSTTNPPLR